MFDENRTISYFMNLNQFEVIRKGMAAAHEFQDNKPYYIEFIRPGEEKGVRITFPTETDRDEIFNGLVEAL